MKKFFKILYSLLPFKKTLFDLIKLVYEPSSKYYKHLHFKGVFKIKLKDNVFFKMIHFGYSLENEIYWNGLENGWEKYSIDIWKKLVVRSATIFDIGANTGVFALIAKKLNPGSKVYAFEPVSRVFNKLIENVVLNDFEIHCNELALSDNDGDATIYDPGDEHVYSVSVNKNLEEKKRVVKTKIQISRLDTFIMQENISRIDLLKIDVEQHEPQVLRGYGRLMREHKPSMLIEVLTDEVASSVQKQIEGLGYLYFNIDEDRGVRQVKKITKSDSFNFLVCQPDIARDIGIISE